MIDTRSDEPADGPLNPALKSRSETVYDTQNVTPAPIDTASSKEGGGEGWPIAWLIVTVVGIALAIYFLV